MTRFFALISRMRYINRWGLMRNTFSENIQEHSHMVAVLAHALAVIGQTQFGSTVDPRDAAVAALYHDASEILTGDLPTPIKYDNPEIRDAYKAVEAVASRRLLHMLPPSLRNAYAPYLEEDSAAPVHAVVKAADKLSAYIKCVEEVKAGNTEFKQAMDQTLAALSASPLPEVQYFIRECLPAFLLNLDELERESGKEGD